MIRAALLSISRSLGGVDPAELTVTASGTESNQTVLATMVQDCAVLLIGAAEHTASWDFIPHLRKANPGLRVKSLPVRSDGGMDGESLAGILGEVRSESPAGGPVCTVAISLAWANNETGAVLDLQVLADVVRRSGVKCRVHLDGAQAWGKIPVDLRAVPADYVTFSSHKIGAPAGAGLIWKRPSAPFFPLLPGSAFQGRRGGSLNGIGILGMGEASRHVDPDSFRLRTVSLRDRLERELRDRIPGVRIFGDTGVRVANTSRFGFEGFKRYADWVELLDLEGFAVSRGSACKSGTAEPSHVLLAMGVPPEVALNSLRVSIGPDRTWEELERFLNALCALHEKKRMSL